MAVGRGLAPRYLAPPCPRPRFRRILGGMSPASRLPIVLLALSLVALAVSGIRPHDRATWLMEVAPAVGAWAVLLATHRRFPLTPLLYVLVFVHGLILILGGHYTYAEVPLGDWVRDALSLQRNHYDRLGHFAQGFVPVLAAREILLRCTPLQRGGWTAFLSVMTTLGFSAFYELIEWWAAILTEEGATAFLGTQGDPWDTQWDMFMALVGATTAMLALSRVHDASMARVQPNPGR